VRFHVVAAMCVSAAKTNSIPFSLMVTVRMNQKEFLRILHL